MSVRPTVDEATVERVNSQLGGVLRVDPENVGLDKKINVLLDELEKSKRQEAMNHVGDQSGDRRY